jgi:hypothetical protein
MSLSMKALEARAEPQAADDSSAAEAEEQAAPRKPPKRNVPLKGGLGRGKGGAEFGLRW